MNKGMKLFLYCCLYIGVGGFFILVMTFCYFHFPAFKELFNGGASSAAAMTSEEAAAAVAASGQMAARLSFLILIFVMTLQIFAFLTALLVYGGLIRSKEPVAIRLRKVENADLFLDLPLYFGLFGTVSSFIVMAFNPQISRLIAYSSTLVGIIFSVVLRLILQYPLKQKLLGMLEAASLGHPREAGK